MNDKLNRFIDQYLQSLENESGNAMLKSLPFDLGKIIVEKKHMSIVGKSVFNPRLCLKAETLNANQDKGEGNAFSNWHNSFSHQFPQREIMTVDLIIQLKIQAHLSKDQYLKRTKTIKTIGKYDQMHEEAEVAETSTDQQKIIQFVFQFTKYMSDLRYLKFDAVIQQLALLIMNCSLRGMDYEWLAAKGVEMKGTCQLVHQGSCSIQFLRKLMVVSRLGVKYYLPFHLFPLLLRLRKANSPRQVLTKIAKRILYYCKSILFMGLLVAGTKGALCFSSIKLERMDGRVLLGNSFISPLSILLEEAPRQREIGCFVLSRAVRSIYLLLKRRGFLNIIHEESCMHVILMALLYYFYCHYPSTIKFRALYEEIWGKS